MLAILAGKPRFEAVLLTLILLGGAALRVTQIDQSLFGDKLWTWVGATDPGFGGMLDWVDGDQEITEAAGNRLWIVGPPAIVAAVVGSLPVSDPVLVTREVFDGLIETEVVAYEIPASVGERG